MSIPEPVAGTLTGVQVLRHPATGGARTAEAGLGVAMAALLAFTAVALADSWGGRYCVLDLAAGAGGAAAALLRRRHLVAALAGTVAVAVAATVAARLTGLPREPGPALVLALAVVTGAAVRTLPAGRAAAAAAAGLAVVVACQLAGPGLTVVAALNALGWLAALGAGLGLRLVDVTRRVTEERTRQDERLQLARELHDVAAHHLTGIVLQAQAARIVAGRRPQDLGSCIGGIEGAAAEALAAMRRVVGLQRDSADGAPARPGTEQLTELVRRFDGRGVAVRLRLPDASRPWPPGVTSTVYRVVQESLTNVRRHAPHARAVGVTVTQEPRQVRVEVADDGPPTGHRAPHRVGYGLVGMRERVEALGGTLQTGPGGPEGGWSVVATLPVPEETPP